MVGSTSLNNENDSCSDDSAQHLGDDYKKSPNGELKKPFKFKEKPRCNGTIEEYPEWNRDNEYIKTGYRLNFNGIGQILMSVFRLHNETVNVLSHLLGYFMFASFIVYILVHYPNMYKQGYKGL